MSADSIVALLNAEKLELVVYPHHTNLVDRHGVTIAHFCGHANEFARHRWIVGPHLRGDCG